MLEKNHILKATGILSYLAETLGGVHHIDTDNINFACTYVEKRTNMLEYEDDIETVEELLEIPTETDFLVEVYEPVEIGKGKHITYGGFWTCKKTIIENYQKMQETTSPAGDNDTLKEEIQEMKAVIDTMQSQILRLIETTNQDNGVSKLPYYWINRANEGETP